MVLLAAVTGASRAVFFATEVGQVALVDEWERTALSFGQAVDDSRYAQFQALSQNGPMYGVATALANGPVLTFATAAVVFLAFRRGPEGEAVPGQAVSFSQVLSVLAHASVILAIRQVVSVPISYARETTASATSLGVWFPTLDATAPIARFVGALDMFVIWWVVVVALGVAVLYQRRAASMTAAFLGVYAGVALVMAVTMTALGGTA